MSSFALIRDNNILWFNDPIVVTKIQAPVNDPIVVGTKYVYRFDGHVYVTDMETQETKKSHFRGHFRSRIHKVSNDMIAMKCIYTPGQSDFLELYDIINMKTVNFIHNYQRTIKVCSKSETVMTQNGDYNFVVLSRSNAKIYGFSGKITNTFHGFAIVGDHIIYVARYDPNSVKYSSKTLRLSTTVDECYVMPECYIILYEKELLIKHDTRELTMKYSQITIINDYALIITCDNILIKVWSDAKDFTIEQINIDIVSITEHDDTVAVFGKSCIFLYDKCNLELIHTFDTSDITSIHHCALSTPGSVFKTPKSKELLSKTVTVVQENTVLPLPLCKLIVNLTNC